VIYPYLAVAFTLMVTLLNYKNQRKHTDDFTATMNYFLWFFILFLVGPILGIAASGEPLPETLVTLGFRSGRMGLGLLLSGIGVPLTLFLSFHASRDERIRTTYPFSKRACSKPGLFVIFETTYLLFYYIPWEFLFRGLLFFPLIPHVGLWTALSIQTIISTLYHIGHPDTEITGALLGGFVYGIVAYTTGSIIYPIFLHALLGISTDTFIYLRYHRTR